MSDHADDKNDHNYYELLEVSPDAAQNEIHEAFQRAKRTYSPDSPALYSMFSPQEARELMGLIEEAFSVLGNQTRRHEYDQKLRKQNGLGSEDRISPILSEMPTLEEDPATVTPPLDAAIPEADALMDNEEDSMQDVMEQALSAESEASFSQEPTSSDSSLTETSIADTVSASDSSKERTLLSTYDKDDTIEEEISQQSIFDGHFLKKVREYKNVEVSRLSAHTRIGQKYLIAIEENDYSSLPAPVFVRGFITQLAKVLELDHKVVASSYMKILKDSTKKT